jgi:hypothetical protein
MHLQQLNNLRRWSVDLFLSLKRQFFSMLGFISANILKGDVSDVGPGAIAIRVTSAEVIIVAFQQGF